MAGKILENWGLEKMTGKWGISREKSNLEKNKFLVGKWKMCYGKFWKIWKLEENAIFGKKLQKVLKNTNLVENWKIG